MRITAASAAGSSGPPESVGVKPAAAWLGAVLDRMPDDLRLRFDDDWKAIKAGDPSARPKLLHAVQVVLQTNNPAALETLSKRVLEGVNNPAEWASVRNVAKVVLKRVYATSGVVRSWTVHPNDAGRARVGVVLAGLAESMQGGVAVA